MINYKITTLQHTRVFNIDKVVILFKKKEESQFFLEKFRDQEIFVRKEMNY